MRLIRSCLLILSCLLVTTAFALEQQKRLWSGIDISGAFFDYANWEYDLKTQARYNFSDNQYQSTRTEAGLGYKSTPNLSLWLGYTWVVQNVNNRQQHRIWEQALWNIISQDTIQLTSRTRLEERRNIDELQWSTRLRQRLQLTFLKKIFHKYTPIVYEELFINLNNPSWVNNQWINQNRVFVGLDIPLRKKIDLQVGYLNQYQFRNIENRMNHILYVNLNIKT